MEEYAKKAVAAADLDSDYICIDEAKNNLIVFQIEEKDGIRVRVGTVPDEFVLTKEKYLICVTANSCEAIRREIMLGKDAYGFVGTVTNMWYADGFMKIV